MSYTKIEELFSREYLCDKKHKLNTSPKSIPTSILNEIERDGLTLERIEELTKKGFNIYKYSTQITLHGVCDELEKDGRLGGYKCLTINKNKSIGIKWIAVDMKKKIRIVQMLKECGWDCEDNSTSYHPMRIKRVKDASEAMTVANEWKADIERIDHSLFYGTSSIYLARSVWGGVYVVCNLYVNGIKENNVDKLIEQASGLTIAELTAKREARIEAERIRREELNREYEERKAKEKAEADAANAIFYDRLKADGYVEAVSNQQPVGTVVMLVERSWDGKFKREYYRIEKRTANPCHEDGSDDYCGERLQKLIKKPCKVFVKATA